MRTAQVFVQDKLAAELIETDDKKYIFRYIEDYKGPPVSLAMPPRILEYKFEEFPPFFEGLLPEGVQLESLLRREKIDKKDCFLQLMTVGLDLVGDVTVKLKEGDSRWPSVL